MKKIEVQEFGGPEVMHIVDCDMPEVEGDEVLIKVMKASVNYADVKKRMGNSVGGGIPFTPGIDAVGIVVDKGHKVTSIEKGQRVIAFPVEGSYAEYVVAKESLTYGIPDGLDNRTAAACPTVGILSYILLADIARVRAGERVLIHAAAGGVGTTSIQLAKWMGAKDVIGVVSHKDKADVVLEAGADEVLLYNDFAEQINAQFGGVDVILDSVAGDISEKSMECLANYGRLVQFGNAGGRPGNIKTSDLHKSCRSVLGFSLGTTRLNRPESIREAASEVLTLLDTNQLRLHISEEYPLEKASDAHAWLESRKSTGKLLLHIL
ncbi:NADPH:quinone oxidoreductase family protein [Pontibacillus salipaludis]|uniref:quinone oxidoreductase family protein n=1 Tax=Pontibacillus salipaludis TaxID=1697394 RepID=UPI0031E88B35